MYSKIQKRNSKQMALITTSKTIQWWIVVSQINPSEAFALVHSESILGNNYYLQALGLNGTEKLNYDVQPDFYNNMEKPETILGVTNGVTLF